MIFFDFLNFLAETVSENDQYHPLHLEVHDVHHQLDALVAGTWRGGDHVLGHV